jgi:hypothetical protein
MIIKIKKNKKIKLKKNFKNSLNPNLTIYNWWPLEDIRYYGMVEFLKKHSPVMCIMVNVFVALM